MYRIVKFSLIYSLSHSADKIFVWEFVETYARV